MSWQLATAASVPWISELGLHANASEAGLESLTCAYSCTSSCLAACCAEGKPSLRLLPKSSCTAPDCSNAVLATAGWALANTSRNGMHCPMKISPHLHSRSRRAGCQETTNGVLKTAPNVCLATLGKLTQEYFEDPRPTPDSIKPVSATCLA